MLNVFNVIPVIATVLPSKRRLQSDPLVGPFTKILQIEKRILRCTLVENIQVIKMWLPNNFLQCEFYYIRVNLKFCLSKS